jgi:hypothetical protein
LVQLPPVILPAVMLPPIIVALSPVIFCATVFVPPFSPEGRPVDELEANGIATVIIELLIIGLLVYLAKGFSSGKIMIDKQTRNMK